LGLFGAVLIGLGLSALVHPVAGFGAEIKPEIKYVYYEVPYTNGLSVSDLIARHTTLFNAQGRPLSGITDYSIWYEINHASQIPGLCGVKDPKVFCKCEITLPRLVGAEADPLIRAEFKAKLDEIRRHELTHCDIAVRYAETMLASYRQFKEMPCDESAEAVAREFERIIAECWEAQLLFDHSEYGYKDHLDPGDFQRSVGENYRISPQTRGAKPSQDQAIPPAAPRTRPQHPPPVAAPPIRVEKDLVPTPSPVPATPTVPPVVVPPNGGIYKDKDGVWRNY
jgi:predicted secreted Zn-dependent protease